MRGTYWAAICAGLVAMVLIVSTANHPTPGGTRVPPWDPSKPTPPVIFPVPGKLVTISNGVVSEDWQDRGTGAARSDVLVEAGAKSAALSPDGRYLVYMTQKRVILHDLASGAERTIEDANGVEFHDTPGGPDIAWAPDSRKFTYFFGYRLFLYDLKRKSNEVAIKPLSAYYGTALEYGCPYAGVWIGPTRFVFTAYGNLPISIEGNAASGCLRFERNSSDPGGRWGSPVDGLATVGNQVEVTYSTLPAHQRWLASADGRHVAFFETRSSQTVSLARVPRDFKDSSQLHPVKLKLITRLSVWPFCEEPDFNGVVLTNHSFAYVGGDDCQIDLYHLDTMKERLGPKLPEAYRRTSNGAAKALWFGNPDEGAFATLYVTDGPKATLSLVDSRRGIVVELEKVKADDFDQFGLVGWIPGR